MTLLLCAAALAQPVPTSKVTAESETLAELRQDLHGDTFVPVYEYVRFDTQSGNTQVVGYAGLEAVVGLERPADVDIYTLHARRKLSHGEWVIGRQQATTLLRRQTFDGVRWWWRPEGPVALDVWGGYGRHQGVDDFLDGSGIARASLNATTGPMLLRAGAQVEYGPDTPLVTRQDLQARVVLGSTRPAVLEGLVAVAQPDLTAEWARVQVRTPRVGPMDLSLHVQHRQAADPDALFGDAILADLAGGAVDEAGAGLRVHGAAWARFSASYRVLRHGADDPTWGHAVEVSYAPPLGGTVHWSPRYAFRTGPGGTYHALYARGSIDLGDLTRVGLWGAAVPYRKGDDPWHVGLDAGMEGRRAITGGTTVRLFADAASDGLYQLELRLGAAITVTLR